MIDFNLKSVFFEETAKKKLAETLESQSEKKKLFLLVDSNTFQNCYPNLLFLGLNENTALEVIEIDAGEKHKTLNTAEGIVDTLLFYGADKNSILFNLGGGVVTDIGGFVASIFKRGITYYNIPTSLMGMVDASIGGKTAVNSGNFKNQIGSFYNPKGVFVISDFLETLPKIEIESGFGEMIKHSLLLGHQEWLEITNMPSFKVAPNPERIRISADFKSKIVAQDFLEKNQRKLLNLGHTAAHALEGLYLKKRKKLSHGLAVLAGIAIECAISNQLKKLPNSVFEEITSTINSKFNLPIFEINDFDLVLELMFQDKKNENQELNFTLLDDFGKASINQFVSEIEVKQALNQYLSIINSKT